MTPQRFRLFMFDGVAVPISLGQLQADPNVVLIQDPSYISSMYSDRAGTTGAGADTVVGVQLDLSDGLVLGPELVTNGIFASDISGWTANLGTASWDAGTLKAIGQGGTFGRVVNSVTTVAGRGYLFSGSCTASSTVEATFLRVTTSSDGGSGGQLLAHTGAATWDKSGVFVATGATTYIAAVTGNLNTTANFDNISVREILGNHAIAPSDAARPLLKKNANGKWYLLRDGVDDNLPITFPNLGSNCVTYVCDGTQVVKTTGVTLNGAHNTTTPTNDYGRIYCAAPPTAAREAQIIKYLKAKAGLV